MNNHSLNQILLIGLITLTSCTAQADDEQELIAVLQSQAGVPAKCAACQQLRIYGTAKSVPTVAALLGAERLGHAARYALEAMHYAQAGAALRDALGRTSGLVKVGLIDSLGWRRDTASVPLLVPLLSHADTMVAAAAASALGRIGDDDATTALSAARNNANPEVKIAVSEALLRCAQSRLSTGDDSGAAAIYRDLLQAEPAPAIRIAAWRGVALSDGNRRAALVVEALTGSDEQLRLVAIKLMRQTKDQQLLDACLRRYKSLPAGAQALLIDNLAHRGDRAALAHIRRAYKSSKPAVRIAAIKAVGILGDAACVAFLAEPAARSPGDEQAAARDSLRVLGGGNINLEMIAQIKEADSAVRVELIDALADRGATEATPLLLRMAESGDRAVRPASYRALRQLGGLGDVETLLALLLDAPDGEQKQAENAILGIAQRRSAAPEISKVVVDRLDSVKDAVAKCVMIRILGRLGHPSALPAMRAALSSADSQRRYAAIQGLSAWPTAEPKDDLLRVARTSNRSTHRVLALRGYIDLVGRDTSSDDTKLEMYKQAMALTTQAADKKRVLSGLTQLRTIGALEMARQYLDDADIRNEAALAAVTIARAIPPEPDRVKATFRKGANDLMLKVTHNNMPWGAIVRVCEAKKDVVKVGSDFKIHVINAESKFEAAGICDVNRDGKLDIVSGGYWYEAPQWKQHFIRKVQYDGNYYYDFASLPMDIDGDGWVDIAGAAWHNKMVFWVRNPGKAGGEWPLIEVDTPGNMETALAYDINGDGQLDILPNIMNQAAWYEFHRDASVANSVRWEKHPLPQQAAGHGIGAGDINGDGRCDIVAPRGWVEQPAHAAGEWTWHGEFDLGHCSIPALVHDVDGDDDADIIWGFGHNYGLFWLEQGKDTAGGRTWTRHEIDSSWSQPHFMLLADLDNDGDKELVTGKRYHAHNGKDPGGNDAKCIYYYTFDRSQSKWQRRLISEGGAVAFGINTQAADIDKDGDIDIVAPGKSGLYLLENQLN